MRSPRPFELTSPNDAGAAFTARVEAIRVQAEREAAELERTGHVKRAAELRANRARLVATMESAQRVAPARRRVSAPRCPTTGKVRFHRRHRAKTRARSIGDQRRAYWCPHCRGWHLSSKAEGERKR